MRKSTRPFIRNCVQHLPLSGPIYEFGSLQVHEKEKLENLRPLFEPTGCDYVGCDMRAGPGVDQIQNLHRLEIPDNTVGCVVSIDTLEHVEFPRRAMAEILRILKPDGIAIMGSVFQFPIHGYPNDYWRFTPEGLRSLFRNFQSCLIYSHGYSEVNPRTVIGVGFKGQQPDIKAFDIATKKWENWYSAIAKEYRRQQSMSKS